MNTSGSGLSGLCICVLLEAFSLSLGDCITGQLSDLSHQRLRGPLKAFLPLFYYMHKFLLVIQLYVVFMNSMTEKENLLSNQATHSCSSLVYS